MDDNIKTDLKEINCKDEHWINMDLTFIDINSKGLRQINTREI
jgi:hypothetical protein